MPDPPLFSPNDLLADDDPDAESDVAPRAERVVPRAQLVPKAAVTTGAARAPLYSTSGLATRFADPLDVANYYQNVYRGMKPERALAKGDPGVGSPYLGEIETSKAYGVAVPEDQLRKALGNDPAAWRTARAKLTYLGQSVTVPIVDIGPGSGPRSRGVVTDLTDRLSQALGTGDMSKVQMQIVSGAGPDYTTQRQAWDREQAQIAQLLQGNIAAFKQGGIVTEPTIALVGETGPEAIVPLGQHSVFGNPNNMAEPYGTHFESDTAQGTLLPAIGRMMGSGAPGTQRSPEQGSTVPVRAASAPVASGQKPLYSPLSDSELAALNQWLSDVRAL